MAHGHGLRPDVCGWSGLRMVQYIKELVQTLEQARGNIVGEGVRKILGEQVPDFWTLLQGIREEVDRLDPRDFVPAAQHDFVVCRTQLRSWASQPARGNGEQPLALALALSGLLDHYAGDGSRAETKDFSFVNDADLREIVVRDYRELSLILLPAGAWKSVVVLAGSVLEAILYDQLSNDATNNAAALAATSAPRRHSGAVIPHIGDWKLIKLIEVSAEINVLSAARAQSIDQVLRDYRNFVHPTKEIRAAHPCSEAEAMMSKGALDGVYNHLHP